MKLNKLFSILKKNQKNTFLFIFIKRIAVFSIYFLNKISNYQIEKIRFYKKIGYKLNLKNPRSFNEKIVWRKIYDKNPLLPLTSDKYQVRSYVKDILGEDTAKEILIPLFYATDKPKTIPFEELNIPYIIKPNHASGLKIIVENDKYDKQKIIKTCQSWLNMPYGLEKMEWAYQPIKRKIIIEKLLCERNGKLPKDYKFHVFHGRCFYSIIISNRTNNLSAVRFDRNWEHLSSVFAEGFPSKNKDLKLKKPKNYETMLEIVERLAEPFDYVRVDLYNINGQIYFGELTHYQQSGLLKFEPVSFDFELGKQWNLKSEYWKQKCE